MVADQAILTREGHNNRAGFGGSGRAAEAVRLTVMPRPAPVVAPGGGRRGWREDVAELGLRRLSAFLAEAAVLVLVLGLLERLLAVHRVEWGWAVAVVGISAGLLGGSVGLELLERRRG